MEKSIKRRPGRPAKSIEDKPQQFSIRLRPRYKLGLELLAADMQMSLSQLTEMALQEMFQKLPLSNGLSVDEVLRDFPPNPTPAERTLLIYRSVPNALPLPLRATAHMVWESKEMREAIARRDDEASVWEVITWVSQQWPVILEVARKQGPRIMAGKGTFEGINLHAEVDAILEEMTAPKESEAARRKRVGVLF